ncbi:septal ring lytic transglycosylase RlpA family protein [Methylorubrum extorquens]|uniref:Endolytic peptidoglycan transglycosylase RlpA n=1 Tax=Methylorubrum extorquens TaxID=408 RepID=A0AAX3WNL7_METEX|nr:septal ring lytic transglycosylase RlpA family protein [Methylorubrum extorquens]WHQ72516.1 septal ring lytic transglycosylase RlpA family protein [Methylorubrum extorquens]
MLLHHLAVRAALACLVLASAPAHADWTGTASFYGHESGSRRADGRPFVPEALGAAHWTLPLGTPVRVTDLATGRHVDVRINDRGPFVHGRSIELARGAARVIGCGTCRVALQPL